jgi:hypothetical protein
MKAQISGLPGAVERFVQVSRARASRARRCATSVRARSSRKFAAIPALGD